ncbi:carbohydrate porin [Gammaproteobacteria bacterium]|nr:carbohydrate porin [Gammaproteobacteria bacterium]
MTNKATYLALVVSALVGTAAQAEGNIEWGGNVELDFDAVSFSDQAIADGNNEFDSGGRVKLWASASEGGVSGLGEVLLGEDGETGVDDAWVNFDFGGASLKVGRFEAFDVYQDGKDPFVLDWGQVVNYEVELARGRVDDAGQLALTVPMGNMSFELGTVWGTGDSAFSGVRPTLNGTFGDFRFGLGYEFLNGDEDVDTTTEEGGDTVSVSTDSDGGGLYLTYQPEAFALKFSYATATIESGAAGGAASNDVDTMNLNLETGPFGIGIIMSGDDNGDEDTIYAAYSIFDVLGAEGARVDFAASYSDYTLNNDGGSDDATGVRVRFWYEF